MFNNECGSSMLARLYIIIAVFEDSSFEDIRIVKSSAMIIVPSTVVQDLLISIILIFIFRDMRKTLPTKLLQQLEMI